MRGPMSTPIQPSGMSSVGHHLQVGVLREAVGHQHVHGQLERAVEAHGLLPSGRAPSPGPRASSCSEAPTGSPCAARNVKHIAPPISTRSHRSSRRWMSGSLSLTFEPPSTATNGRRGFAQQPAQHLDLAGEQQPGAGGEQLRDALGGRVGAVGGAEGVVDVVGEARPRARSAKAGSFGLLLGVEAQVLEHHELAGRRGPRPARAPRGRRSRAGSSTDRDISSPRRSAQGRSDSSATALALGAAEVRAHGHAGPRGQQALEGGHRGARCGRRR